jgi:F-type H+-transporting ATPase subunit b
MLIDWWTLSLQTINVLVLIFILSRFLFRPIAAIIAERKAATARLVDEAAAAKAEALALDEKARNALGEISASRTAAVRAATDEAKAARDALMLAARAEADRLRAEAQSEIERLKKAERREEAKRVSLLAVDIARRLFQRLPREAQVAGFVEGLATAVAALPPETRAEFNQRGDAILKAPRALTAEEEAMCRQALAKAFGRPLALSVSVDDGVLAGLELENQHASVQNSFRADLARMAAELSRAENV